MTLLNVLGSQPVARAQTVIVYVVIGILTVFAVATLTNIHPHLLAFSHYPTFRDIVSSWAPLGRALLHNRKLRPML